MKKIIAIGGGELKERSTIKIDEYLAGLAETDGIRCDELVGANEAPTFEKYDEYIPADLLRRAYATDRLRSDEPTARLEEMKDEYR